MLINRTFVHKEFGQIGSVEFATPDGEWTLGGHVLSESSVDAILNHAMQILQDAYAGAKTEDEAGALFDKRLGRLIDGTYRVRGGTGVDAFTVEARIVTRAALKAQWGAKSKEWAKFTGLSDDDQAAQLDEVFAKNESKLRPIAEKEVERKAAVRAEKAALRNALGGSLDI